MSVPHLDMRVVGGPIVALPGASTTALIAIEVPATYFVDQLTKSGWLPKLREIIPTSGIDRRTDAASCRHARAETAPVLGLRGI